MRAIDSLAVADTLAEHHRADQTGHAGVDMHNRTAGEVECAVTSR